MSMKDDRYYCVNENEVEEIRIARQGSPAYSMTKRLFDPETSGSRQAMVVVATVPPHQKDVIPAHYHVEYEETIYVVEGQGVIQIGEEPEGMRSLPLRRGSCCYIPVENYHVLKVEGDEAMKILCSYFHVTGKGGKSHRQFTLELTNVPFQGNYGSR
jgi:quercetin dioxygenase-like cupin family protein